MSEEGKAIAGRVIELQGMIIRWSAVSIDRYFNKNGKKPDVLTKTQAEIIATINTLEKATISQLENILCTSKSSLSITVGKLFKEGYINKERDDTDGRVVYLTITEKGKTSLKKVIDGMTEGINMFYDNLNTQEKELFETGIDCFYKILNSKWEER